MNRNKHPRDRRKEMSERLEHLFWLKVKVDEYFKGKSKAEIFIESRGLRK